MMTPAAVARSRTWLVAAELHANDLLTRSLDWSLGNVIKGLGFLYQALVTSYLPDGFWTRSLCAPVPGEAEKGQQSQAS